METVKDVAQIIYYVTLSIAGPLALIEYFKAKKRDRLANEYKIYDELNNRFFEYQKIALEYYDLDILDVPNNDPSLAFDKKRKQEMVAYAILFSLFERAFLMFHHQAEAFQLRQWSGWKHFLNDFIRRETVRTAWQLQQGDVRHGLPAVHGREDRRDQGPRPAPAGRARPATVARERTAGRPTGGVTVDTETHAGPRPKPPRPGGAGTGPREFGVTGRRPSASTNRANEMTGNLTHPAGLAAESIPASAAPSRTARTPPKFPRDTDGFQAELDRRVQAYFGTTGKSERDCWAMYLKTAVILAWGAASYVCLVFVAETWWQAVPAAVSLALALAGVGFSIQHDGGHRAYSRRAWINWLAASSLDLIGASSYLWHWKHDVFHHTYANVPGQDTDIEPGAALRLSPHQPRRWFHRWQHLYLWPLYAITAARWHLYGDFKDYLTGTIGPHPIPRPRGWDLAVFWVGKLASVGFSSSSRSSSTRSGSWPCSTSPSRRSWAWSRTSSFSSPTASGRRPSPDRTRTPGGWGRPGPCIRWRRRWTSPAGTGPCPGGWAG